MKILFLSPAAQSGGAETVLLDILKGLREAKPEWALHVICAEEGPLIRKIADLGLEAELLPFPNSIRGLGENRMQKHRPHVVHRLMRFVPGAVGAMSYRRRLRGRIALLRPDVVHSNGMKMHFLSALSLPGGKQASPQLIWHFHDYLSARPLMSRLLSKVANRCGLIIANSNSVAEDARRLMPSTLSVRTVYNSVDTNVFTPDGPRLDLDQLAGLPMARPGTIRIGLVATFAFWKGHKLFLEAIRLLKSDLRPQPCELRFYIIGGPVYATSGSQVSPNELKETARSMRIDDVVGFTGIVDDVPAALRALDIVVHASTEPEPFGLVIIQAMACGRAVISSALGGSGELVRADLDAMTFPAGDAQALAMSIDRLASDSDLRAQLGHAGRTKTGQDFSRAQQMQSLIPAYEILCRA